MPGGHNSNMANGIVVSYNSTAGHPKPPSLPVRMNRRVTLKPLSEMHGDNLPMLKKIKTSELSQQVRGHNASEENRKKRLLKQWFGEQEYQIEKMKRRQDEMFQTLTRIHRERRELQREMYIWHHEEERVHRIMREQSRKIIEESHRISEEMAIDKNELLLIPLKKRQRRMSQIHAALIQENKFNQNLASASSSPVLGTPRLQDSMKRINSPNLQQNPEVSRSSPEPVHRKSQSPLPTPNSVKAEESVPQNSGTRLAESLLEVEKENAPTRKRGVFMRANVLEVRKDSLLQPFIREKSMEMKTDQGPTAASPTGSTSQRLSQHSFEETSPRPLLQGQLKREMRGIVKLPSITRTYVNTHETIVENQELQPLSKNQKSRSIHDEKLENMELKPFNSTVSHPEDIKCEIRKSQVKINIENRKLRELETRKQLEEEFTAYRMDSNGEIYPLEQPPSSYPVEEPTNKDKYKTERILDAERRHFLEHVIDLKRYTADVVSEDLRKQEALQQAAILSAQKAANERGKSSLGVDEMPTIGPLTWIRVFMHSHLPPGIDPNSIEALKYCRYIRRPLSQLTPEEREEILAGHPTIAGQSGMDDDTERSSKK